ncbi:hypothetical protein [Candidatus Palauibacter sp.]|uniref:hypothetical protein n=1 Tax=Candidatus Palauibacter sp. TaxID=3101350 RepID=UPI003B5BED60
MISNANDLMERLRKKLETERREIEELTADELERLAGNSRRAARHALRTIRRDTEEATGRMRELLLKAWARPLIVGMALWLGIFGGSWATMQWLSRSIQNRIEKRSMVDLEIAGGREMLAEIEETTWGVGLREVNGVRYVTLPTGTPVLTAFTVDGRPYVELSRE